MAFELNSRHDIGQQVRQVARRQLDKALNALTSRSHTARSRDESVHTARKRLKEVRALLRLVRDDLGEKQFDRENSALRDSARPLSEVRDATALVDALKSLQEHYAVEVKERAFEPVRKALRSRRTDIRHRILKEDGALEKVASSVRKVHNRILRWNLRHGAWKALQSGLGRAYKQGRKAMAAASKDRSDEHLHEWRKRAKDLRYQLEFLGPLWPGMMKPAAEQAGKLTDLLGDDHDLAVLRGLLDSEFKQALPVEGAETLRALIDRRRKELQESATSLSEKLFAESPGQFVARFKTYWKTAA